MPYTLWYQSCVCPKWEHAPNCKYFGNRNIGLEPMTISEPLKMFMNFNDANTELLSMAKAEEKDCRYYIKEWN